MVHSNGQFKVMHISIVNITLMVTDKVKITIAIKQKVMYPLSISIIHSTLACSKDQSQEHAYFGYEYLINGDR